MKLTAKSVVAAASKSPGFVFFLLQTRNGLTGLDWTGLDWTGLTVDVLINQLSEDSPVTTSHYWSLLSPLRPSPAQPHPGLYSWGAEVVYTD